MYRFLTFVLCLSTSVAGKGNFEKRYISGETCKAVPGDPSWPSEGTWKSLSLQVGGRLIKTSPIAQSCYQGSNYNSTECESVVHEWTNTEFTTTNVIGRTLPYYIACPPLNHTAGDMPVRSCVLGINPVMSVNATSRSDISATIEFARKNNIRLVTSGTGHDLLGRSDGFGALQLWLRYYRNRIIFQKVYEPTNACKKSSWKGNAIVIDGVYQWRDVAAIAKDNNVFVATGGSGTVGAIGGWSQGGGHGPATTYVGWGVDQILEAEVMLANGRIVTANSCENSDLYRSLRGGGPGFGVVLSMTVKAHANVQVVAVHHLTMVPHANANNTSGLLDAITTLLQRTSDLTDAGVGGYGFWYNHYDRVAVNSSTSGYKHQVWTIGKNESYARTVLDPLVKELQQNQSFRVQIHSDYETYDDYWSFFNKEMAFDGPQGKTTIMTSRAINRNQTTDFVSLRKIVETISDAPGQDNSNCILFTGGKKIAADGNDPFAGYHPAWRKASFGIVTVRVIPLNITDTQRSAVEKDMLSKTSAMEVFAPGTGAYMNEADRLDPQYIANFYGANYPHHLRTKHKYDPDDLFYCATCVGSEEWFERRDGPFPPKAEKKDGAIRFAILGASKIAPMALITPAMSHPEVIVQAIAARDRGRAEEFAKKHGIPEVKDSYEDILSDPNIDAVFIPLPNGLHYEWSVKAIRAGKHVLVEKPSTSTSVEAGILFNLPELSRPNPPVLLEAFHNRFHPAVQKFMTFISPPDVIDIYTDNMVPWWFTKKTDLEYNYQLGGGSIMALGTYNFALMRMAFGSEPVECLSCETEVFADGVHDRCDHSFQAEFRFPNGTGKAKTTLQGPLLWKPSECRVTHKEVVVADEELGGGQEKVRVRVATLHGCMHAVLWHRIDVKDEYKVRVKETGEVIKKWKEGNSYKAYTHREAGGEQVGRQGEDWWMSYRYQLEAFVDRIKGRDVQYWVTGEDSIQQMRMVDMAYEKSGLGLRPTTQPAGDFRLAALSQKGKSILVTGGGNTGIGGETARYFARAGATRIGLLGRREGPLLENKAAIEKECPGTEIFIQCTDVTDEASVNSAFDNFAKHGKIDTLIHAAAAIGPKENFADVDAHEFLKAITDNIEGSLWVAKAFIRTAAPDAHVVAINSWGSHLSLNDAYASYCVAKMAVYRLWDTVLLAKPNLSVFHTQPGVVLTEMNLKVGGAESFKNIKTDDGELYNPTTHCVGTNQTCIVTLPASVNLWLSTPEARFLKGKFLWCNWDIEDLKYIPTDKEWPGLKEWNRLNQTVDGRLIATVPVAHVCHKTGPFAAYDQGKCEALQFRFGAQDPGTLFVYPCPSLGMPNSHRDINDTCSPFTNSSTSCELGNRASYSINVTGPDDVRAGIEFARTKNIRLVIRNTGIDYLGQSTGSGALALWTYNLKATEIIHNYNSTYHAGPAVRLGSGVTAGEAYQAMHLAGYRIVTAECGLTGAAGGYIQAGGQSQLVTAYGLAADQVLEWEVVTLDGQHLIVTPENHADLYWALAGGGGGTYAIVLSVALRIFPEGPVVGGTMTVTSANTTALFNAVGMFFHQAPSLLDNTRNNVQLFITNDTLAILNFVMPDQNSTASIDNLLADFLPELKRLDLPYNLTKVQYPTYLASFISSYGPLPYGTLCPTFPIIGSRLIPRKIVQNRQTNRNLMDLYSNITSDGTWWIGCSILNVDDGPGSKRPPHPPNSVLPAWRKAIAYCNPQTHTPYPFTDPALAQALRKTLVGDILPRLEAATPGGGMLNEIDPTYKGDWKNAFFGGNYERLLDIKHKYDPMAMLYGLFAVGSDEFWFDGEGRLCNV
ncbi:fad binding domain-containing [Pyrenophora seminiperda CCB06]|uniref:Fad binding domain-containing n=1 Tax=Pyrenophora seminiperda CCB06 TaxID=1302712 RepID=A0A3M7LVD4_9PLEO|nr:fad binding domain-containing [Pyrenophora seminiperda CCB06]